MRSSCPRHFQLHYAWIIVLSGFLTLFACLGLARFAYAMLLPGMRTDLALGYDRMGLISTANFIGYLVAVALAPRLLKRLRPRLTISLGLLLIAACMLTVSAASRFQPILICYALVGFGSGMANIPAMVLVSHWFRPVLRGRAAGLMISGNGVAIIFAGFLVPRLNAAFGTNGWRIGWLCLGGMVAGIALLVSWMLRNDPKTLGLEPLGETGPASGPQSPAREQGHGKLLLLLGLLYLVFGATYMVYGTFIVTSMVEEYGLNEATAGFYWSLVGLLSIFSGIAFGVLSDRIGRKAGLALVFLVQSCAYLLAGSGLGEVTLILSILLYGFSVFAIPTIMAAAVGDFFGLQRAAMAFSLITFFFAAGQTVGPGLAGVLAEAVGSFSPAYFIAGGLTLLAALLAMLLPGRTEN
ncbi:MFS transporter [Geothermobacter hydrogeniphilus]|uniref:MFS transporter n=1 Tax=Geothermobacter hydrogeniphilus TaxID=1969733 RepID=A0A2K2H6L2_9BACT|nr:YbfB/YjiJ family MFS transporter [Geothermobacter hydrogeniphilus]PNU18887.1 MFS transporter [Geothermobacter hydrogeniphilus]